MKIVLTVKSVYGNNLVYPVCDTAKNLAKLTGQKTFSQSHLKTIEAIGYTIALELQSLPLAA